MYGAYCKLSCANRIPSRFFSEPLGYIMDFGTANVRGGGNLILGPSRPPSQGPMRQANYTKCAPRAQHVFSGLYELTNEPST